MSPNSDTYKIREFSLEPSFSSLSPSPFTFNFSGKKYPPFGPSASPDANSRDILFCHSLQCPSHTIGEISSSPAPTQPTFPKPWTNTRTAPEKGSSRVWDMWACLETVFHRKNLPWLQKIKNHSEFSFFWLRASEITPWILKSPIALALCLSLFLLLCCL